MINTLIGVITLGFAWAIYHQLGLLVRLIAALRSDLAKLLPPAQQNDEGDEWEAPLLSAPQNMGELRAAYRSAPTPRVWRFEAPPEE
jgi:hypothetical protein